MLDVVNTDDVVVVTLTDSSTCWRNSLIWSQRYHARSASLCYWHNALQRRVVKIKQTHRWISELTQRDIDRVIFCFAWN